MHKNPLSAVINDGFTDKWFPLQKSTRQGDPAGPLILALVAEMLGIKIRNNVKIVGIETENYTFLSEQYADDLWVALELMQQNLNNLLEEVEEFSKFAGLKINYDKTAVLRLGPLRKTNAKFYTQRQLHW